jgi:hypothetical protein
MKGWAPERDALFELRVEVANSLLELGIKARSRGLLTDR